jgi:hypothetical protein
VIENAFAETVHEGQPMRGRKINPCLPLLGAHIPERLRRNPVLHVRTPNGRVFAPRQ